MIKKIFLGAVLLLLSYFFLIPFYTLVKHLVLTDIVPHPFFTTFKSSLLKVALKNTMLLGFMVAASSSLIALFLAYLLAKTDVPFKKFWRSSFVLPYTIPPIIGAIAWIILANPSNGLLNNLLGLNFNIYSFTGLVWIETSFLFTYVLLILLKAMEGIDPTLEEASRMSGATSLKTFFKITFPLIKAPLMNGFMLVFLATTASFGVPALIGTPGGIFLLTTQIYTFQKMGSMSGLLNSISVSMLLISLALFVLYLSEGPLRPGQYATISGKTPRAQIFELKKWRWPILFLITLLFLLFIVLPLGAISYSAFSEIQGIIAYKNLSLSNLKRILFSTDETSRAFMNSLKYATATSFFCLLAGLVLAFANKFIFGNFAKRVSSILVAVPYVTPGTVLALGLLIGLGPGVFGHFLPLNNTGTLIVIAYFIKYLNFSYKTLEDGVGQVHPCLIEASRLSGAGPLQTIWKIWLPLLRPSIFAGLFLVFMPALFEVTMTILLTGPGLESVGTLIFQLQEYGDLNGGGPAVLALMVIVPTCLINFFVKWVTKGKYGV